MRRFFLSLGVLTLFAFQFSSIPFFSSSASNKYSSVPGAPPLAWNTFLSVNLNAAYPGRATTVDANGNFYAAGPSTATWGTPVDEFDGQTFVVKVSNAGTLVWNTFIGSSTPGMMAVRAMTVDGGGNVYLTGYSVSGWGTPVHSNAGNDVMVVKLNSSGELIWNTFMGSDNLDDSRGIAVDENGNIYVAGSSSATWGSPVRSFRSAPGYGNSFVAKLNGQGELQWNTFLGGQYTDDSANNISIAANGIIGIGGQSYNTWGTPVSPYAGLGGRGYIVQLDNDGNLLWNTFLGQAGTDSVYDIAPGPGGDVYVSGNSTASWGTPLIAYGGVKDGFVARFDNTGHVKWSTFTGCSDYDVINKIKVDAVGNVYAAGSSGATFGTPTNAYAGGFDGVVLKLNSDGSRAWNTFMGSTGDDGLSNIGVDLHLNLYLIGGSTTSWGTPLNPWTDGNDLLFAELGYNYDHQIYLPLIVR